MNTRDLLLALVRDAIRGEELSQEAKEALTQKRLATLYKVAKKHDVAHLVCHALQKNEIHLEGEVWDAFLKEKDQALLRYEMIQVDLNEICFCFDKEGIDYIPLKGAVVRTYYPEPWMRTSCDIDILVREDELDRAVNALVKHCSYRVEGKKTFHDISLYSPFGMHLELHHNIKETVDKYDAVLTRVWEFAQKTGEKKQVQTNEFLVFHLLAHMAYHFVGGGCGIRSVLDLWILKDKLSINQAILSELVLQAGLLTFYKNIISLIEYWFDGAKSNEIVCEMEKYILLGGVYGTQLQNATFSQVKKGGKLKYFWSRVFLSYESLAILYPIIKKHKILTPFCQVARWFGALFKVKRLKKEVGLAISVSGEHTKNAQELLKKLEL